MRNIKKYILLFSILSISIFVQSANTAPTDSVNRNQIDSLKQKQRAVSAYDNPFDEYKPQLPSINAMSPQVAQFMRYGEIPVSHSTGVPDISVPIYTLKANGLEIPISISYHAGGIKVQDISSTVGLGWTLNVGGVISQSIYKGEDYSEQAVQYGWIQFPFSSDLDFEAMIQKTYAETSRSEAIEPYFYRYYALGENPPNIVSDRFYYNFNGNSGVFRYDIKTKELIGIPHSTFKFKKIGLDCFQITDNEGIIWSFKRKGETNSFSGNHHLTLASIDYYLTEIIFPGVQDKVLLSYDLKYGTGTCVPVETIFDGPVVEYEDHWGGAGPPNDTYSIRYRTVYRNIRDSSFVGSVSNNRAITNINWGEVNINFRYSDTEDYNIGSRLSDISINNGKDNILNASFSPKYLGDNKYNTRMLLNDIKIGENKYSFTYNEMILPNYYRYGSKIPIINSEDYWGYYNGNINNFILPYTWTDPYYTAAPSTFEKKYIRGREPDPNYTQAGILTSITYPTKGKTVFTYEQNNGTGVYDNFNNMGVLENHDFGGVRIKKLSNYGTDGQLLTTKSYEYEGGPTIALSDEHFIFQSKFVYLKESAKDPNVTLGHSEKGEVEEASLSLGFPASELPGGQQIFYDKVTEYHGTSSDNIGKTEYFYNRDQNYSVKCQILDIPNTYAEYLIACDKGIIPTTLLGQLDYEFDKSKNGYILKRALGNEYVNIDKGTTIVGVSTYHEYKYQPADLIITSATPQNFMEHFDFYQNFKAYNILAIHNIRLKSETTVKDYTDNGVVETITKYGYDDPMYRLLTPIKTETKNSNNQTIINTTTHPFNYSSSVYSEMVSRNMISPVIESTLTQNNSTLKKRTDYRNWSNNIFAPERVNFQLKDKLEPRISFHNYDNRGNPIYMSKDNATNIVYLWSYSGQYPIAEIKNASYNEVKSALGWDDNYINSLSGKVIPSDSDMTKVNSLRALLPNAMVTTYIYKPLVGMTSVTDPRGIKSTYEYDDFSRLKSIKDYNGRIIEAYDYGYSNK